MSLKNNKASNKLIKVKQYKHSDFLESLDEYVERKMIKLKTTIKKNI